MSAKNFLILAAVVFFAGIVFAIGTPDVTSPNYPSQDQYYNEEFPEFTWAAVDGATTYQYMMDQLPDTVPEAGESTTATTVEMPPKLDGIYYFHVRACAGSNCGEPAHYKIMVDKTGASAVARIFIEATPDAKLKLTWNPPEGDISGVASYKIYRSIFRDFDTREVPVLATVTAPEFIDQNVKENNGYFYRIVPVDGAGNNGRVSAQFFGRTVGLCSAVITNPTPSYVNQTTIPVKFTSDVPIFEVKIKLTYPDGTSEMLLEKNSNESITDFNLEKSISGQPEGKFLLEFRSRDESLGDHCDINMEIIYDKTNPSLEIVSPTPNEIIKDMKQIVFTAYDNAAGAGLSRAEFYAEKPQWGKFGEMQLSGSDTNFSYDWNSTFQQNGKYNIKVKVLDKSGNFAEKTVLLEIKNTEVMKAGAQNSIDSLKAAITSLNDKILALAKMSVYSSDLESLKKSADENLLIIQNLFKGEHYEDAEKDANAMKRLIDSQITRISTSDYQVKPYTFNKEQVRQNFSAIGLNDAGLGAEAEAFIKNSEVGRNLKIIKVTDLNLEYYVVNVEINFKNKDVNFKEVRIVEYIPKDFASDANKITSDRNYTVLRYDPVIVFENIRAGEGKLLTLVYSLNQKYTKDQVDAMIANNTIDKFPAPPLVFNKETKLAPENFAGNIFAAIALPDLGALFGGGQAAGQASSQGIDIVVIVVIVFAVLMAVIIILLFMLIMTMRGNHRGSSGFSGKRKLL